MPLNLPSLSALLLALPAKVIAQAPPFVPCKGLVGCGGGKANVLLTSTLPTLMRMLGTFAGGIAVVFVAIAGVQMVLAVGDEGKISSARWSIIYAVIGLAIAVMSQVLVATVITESFGTAGGDLMVALMQDVIRFILIGFNVTFGLVVMIAGFRMTIEGGKTDEFNKSLYVIKWAIAGAVITNSAAALVHVVFTLGL